MFNDKMFTVAGEPSVVTEIRRKVLLEFEDLEFYEEEHRYVLSGKTLPSVTNVVHRFIREPFDEQLQAERYASKKGMTPEYWIQQWRQNSFRAMKLGTKTHSYGECLGYLRAGLPERICPAMQNQYMKEYGFLAPLHPKEEAALKFMNEMPRSMHLVLNEAQVYSGKNPCSERNLKQQLAGTFDMLYYNDGTDGQGIQHKGRGQEAPKPHLEGNAEICCHQPPPRYKDIARAAKGMECAPIGNIAEHGVLPQSSP